MISAVFIFILALSFTIQTTFLELLSLGSVMLDPALIIVVYCGIHFQKNSGIKVGVLVGFIQDSLSGGLLGINTLSKGLIGLFFSALKEKIIVEGILPVSYFLFAASLVDAIIYFVVATSLMGAQIQADVFLYQIVFFGAYNAVAGFTLFYMFDMCRNWMNNKLHNRTFR